MAKRTLKGGAVGSVKEFKKGVKKRGGGTYLKRVPDDGITVRFLTEPDGFCEFYEVYSEDTDPRYRPLLDGEEENYPKQGEGSPSRRYLANVLDVDTKEATLLVLPVSLSQELDACYDNCHTLLDRDYELTKSGKGKETRYKAFPEAPTKRKLSKYEVKDLTEVLLGIIDAIEADDDDEPKKKSKDKGKSKPAEKSDRKGKAKPEPVDEDKPKKRTGKKSTDEKSKDEPVGKKKSLGDNKKKKK